MMESTDKNQPEQQPQGGDMTFLPVGKAKVDERGRLYLPATARLNLFDLYQIPVEEREVVILVRQGMVLLQPVLPDR